MLVPVPLPLYRRTSYCFLKGPAGQVVASVNNAPRPLGLKELAAASAGAEEMKSEPLIESWLPQPRSEVAIRFHCRLGRACLGGHAVLIEQRF
jgi:hypothetical protein